MSGHFICDRCGYDGGHADWCVYLRPPSEQWKGHQTEETKSPAPPKPAPDAVRLQIADQLISIQEDLPNEDNRNVLGMAAHYLRSAPVPPADGAQEQIIRRNYAASAMNACIALADEVVCAQGSAQDIAKSLRERFPSGTGAAEPVALADHDEIGQKVLNQPWEIQRAIVTIAAHCTVLTDQHPTGPVADLAGCISQCSLELANALATPPVRGDRDIVRDFEDVCEKIAASRPQAAYLAMIDGGQGDLLVELDEIRHRARDFLSLPVQSGEGERWYVGAQNDGLFIINAEPRPSNDYPWHDNPNGPTVVLNVTELSQAKAQAIVYAMNRLSRQPPQSSSDGGEHAPQENVGVPHE
jgi:hypothetical protein